MPKPPSAAPAVVDVFFGRWPSGLPGDAPFGALQAAHNAVRGAWERSTRASDALARDDTRTATARASEARRAAYKFCEPVLAQTDRALDAAEREMKALEVERRCKLKRAAQSSDVKGEEIRRWLHGLADTAARDTEVELAVKTGDWPVVLAVIEASPRMTGVSAFRLPDWRERALTALAPDDSERLVLLRRAAALAGEAGSSLNRRLAESFDHSALDAAEGRAAAADAAMRGLDDGDGPEAA